MDNHCTAKKMIIALWWWCSPTHNLYSGFGRQNSTLWRRFNSTLEKKLQISRFFLQKFSFSSWIRSRHFSFLFSKLEIWIPYFSFSSLDLTFWHLVNAWSRSKILWKYFSCSCFFVPRSISSFNGKYGLYFSLSASPSDTNLVLSISSRIEKIPSKMTKKCKM